MSYDSHDERFHATSAKNRFRDFSFFVHYLGNYSGSNPGGTPTFGEAALDVSDGKAYIYFGAWFNVVTASVGQIVIHGYTGADSGITGYTKDDKVRTWVTTDTDPDVAAPGVAPFDKESYTNQATMIYTGTAGRVSTAGVNTYDGSAWQLHGDLDIDTTTFDLSTGLLLLKDGGVGPAKIALTDAQILVGNGSNQGADVAMSGDVAIANTGATSIEKLFANWVQINSFATTADDHDDIDTAIDAAATDNTPRVNLTSGVGVFIDATGDYTAGSALPSPVQVTEFGLTGTVYLRNSSTKEAITDGSGNEVYGVLFYDSGDSKYYIAYFSDVTDTQTAYTFSGVTTVDVNFIENFKMTDLAADAFIKPANFVDLADTAGQPLNQTLTDISTAFTTVYGTVAATNGEVTYAELGGSANEFDGSTVILWMADGIGQSSALVNVPASDKFTNANIVIGNVIGITYIG